MHIEETLAYKLKEYTSTGIYPMHMPGHKRQIPEAIEEVMRDTYGIDMTEVPGTDDLHDAHGIIKESMDHASEVYKTKKTYFLVGGSTLGNLAAIYAVLKRGDQIIICDDSHRSTHHGITLAGAEQLVVKRTSLDDTGIASSIAPGQIEALLEADTDHKIKAVHITSPTYEGMVSDIESIASLTHSHDAILIVDEAHGAHIPFMERALNESEVPSLMPCSAIECGADIVVHSLHKTLPAYTQTSLLHICSDRIDLAKIDEALDIYETSSPSYVLMAGADACIRYMEDDGLTDMKNYMSNLKKIYEVADGLTHMMIWRPTLEMKKTGSVYAFDPGKLSICDRRHLKESKPYAPMIAQKLREIYKIETERATDRYVIAMTSLCDSAEGYNRLAYALKSMDEEG